MTTYALIHNDRGDTGRRRYFDTAPPALAEAKGLKWLPLRRTADPAYDPALQRLGAPETAVGESEVVVSRQAVDLTEAEQLLGMRARRAEQYRERLGKLPGNTREETMGDVHDETLAFFAANQAALEALGLVLPEGLKRILAERAAIKGEIPAPGSSPLAGK
jgi:hypothetical protein